MIQKRDNPENFHYIFNRREVRYDFLSMGPDILRHTKVRYDFLSTCIKINKESKKPNRKLLILRITAGNTLLSVESYPISRVLPQSCKNNQSSDNSQHIPAPSPMLAAPTRSPHSPSNSHPFTATCAFIPSDILHRSPIRAEPPPLASPPMFTHFFARFFGSSSTGSVATRYSIKQHTLNSSSDLCRPCACFRKCMM